MIRIITSMIIITDDSDVKECESCKRVDVRIWSIDGGSEPGFQESLCRNCIKRALDCYLNHHEREARESPHRDSTSTAGIEGGDAGPAN